MTENVESPYQKATRALAAGELEQARAFAKDAIQALPRASQPLTLAGVIELNRGKLVEATRYFREAIRLSHAGSEAAPNWVGWGRVLLIQGDIPASLNCFDKACALASNFAPAHAGRSAALMELGRYQDAEQAARRSLGLQDDALTQLTLARSLLFQSRMDEAKGILSGLKAFPQIEFDVRFHLAGILRAEGKIQEAEAEFRALLDDNSCYPGHYELAQCKTFTRDDDQDLKRMIHAKANLDRETSEEKVRYQSMRRCDLSFSLGKAYDDLGELDRAFGCWQEGNQAHPALESVGLELVEDQLNRTGRWLANRPLNQRSWLLTEREGLASPLWILCMPRAGASLLVQMLNGHSEIESEGELNPILQVIKKTLDERGRQDSQSTSDLFELQTLGKGGECKDARFIANKSPENFIYAPIFSELVVDAKFVSLRRHPLDSALSQYTHLFAKGLGWTYSFDAIIRYHHLYHEALARAERRLGPRLYTVYYERLVADPMRELTRLLAFLNLDYEPNCLEYMSREQAVWTASNVQVRQALNFRGIGKWRKYRKHMEVLIDGLAELTANYDAKLKALN